MYTKSILMTVYRYYEHRSRSTNRSVSSKGLIDLPSYVEMSYTYTFSAPHTCFVSYIDVQRRVCHSEYVNELLFYFGGGYIYQNTRQTLDFLKMCL